MKTRRLGDVIEVPLPRGRFAYGRIYRDASVGFYRIRTGVPTTPPIGSRDFAFFVGVEDTSAFLQDKVLITLREGLSRGLALSIERAMQEAARGPLARERWIK